MLRTILAGIGAISIVGITAVALQANRYADDNPPPRLKVDFAGLDLASPAGVALLDQRIDTAINSICRFDGTQSLHQHRLEQKCRDNAWAGTRPQVAVAVDVARRRSGVVADGAPAYASQGIRIDNAVWRAFQSGHSESWRDGAAHGLVLVSESRRYGMAVCRNISIIRPVRSGWQSQRDGMVCLGSDGMLHDAPRPGEAA